MEKKFDFKKFLSNNAIIILIILLALFVGCTTQNFFTMTNGKNLLLNVAPRFIIACGVSGCLITKGTDLSAGRQVGLAACFSAMLLQSVDYSARMLPWLPDIPWPVALLIVMAVMASGLNGQSFAFNGYLPVKPPERARAIRTLERRATGERQSQVFIEAPYRNAKLLGQLLEVCAPDTRLTLAVDITSPQEYIRTLTVREWRSALLPEMDKRPAIFILG